MKRKKEVINSEAPKILITGGGSGGHLSPAISLINYLRVKSPATYEKLVFVGGTRGMIGDTTASIESRKIPEQGVRFVGIRSGKFHRKLNFTTMKLLSGVFGGFLDARRLIKQENPDLVFSVGGYVTVPVVMAARLAGIPIAIHEQTIVSGLANRISAKFADKVLITFPNSKKYFPEKKTLVVGNPIQESRLVSNLPEKLDPDYRKVLEQFAESSHKKQKKFIFITGGGLGSHTLNHWVLGNLAKLTTEYNILVQVGENQLHDDYKVLLQAIEVLPAELQSSVKVIKWFGEEIGFIYANADLVIARPGANTVLELLVTEQKAVFVPIPWSSNDEQLLNAQYFISCQAGAIVKQSDIDSELYTKIAATIDLPKKSTANLITKNSIVKIVKELSELADAKIPLQANKNG